MKHKEFTKDGRRAYLSALILRSLKLDGAGTVGDVAARFWIAREEAKSALNSLVAYSLVARIHKDYGTLFRALRDSELSAPRKPKNRAQGFEQDAVERSIEKIRNAGARGVSASEIKVRFKSRSRDRLFEKVLATGAVVVHTLYLGTRKITILTTTEYPTADRPEYTLKPYSAEDALYDELVARGRWTTVTQLQESFDVERHTLSNRLARLYKTGRVDKRMVLLQGERTRCNQWRAA